MRIRFGCGLDSRIFGMYVLGTVSGLIIMFFGLDAECKARPSANNVTVAVTLDLSICCTRECSGCKCMANLMRAA